MRQMLLKMLAGMAMSLSLADLGAGSWISIALAEPRKDEPPKIRTSQAAAGSDTQQQYCANVAVAAGAARNARQEKRLAELEQQIKQRLADMEAKRVELQEMLDRYDAVVRKTDETLVDVYSRMRPEAAAEQLTNFDEEPAAALLLHLKPKNSSAILNVMDASHAALLTKKMSSLSSLARVGKKL